MSGVRAQGAGICSAVLQFRLTHQRRPGRDGLFPCRLSLLSDGPAAVLLAIRYLVRRCNRSDPRSYKAVFHGFRGLGSVMMLHNAPLGAAQTAKGSTKMAWEKRGKYRYYYRSIKHAGSVHKQYFGRGRAAQRAAAEDRAKAARRGRLRTQRLEINRAMECGREISRTVKGLIEAALIAAGFHQHDRNWRRRHERKEA